MTKGRIRRSEPGHVMICPKCGSERLEKRAGATPLYAIKLTNYYHCPKCDYSGLSYLVKSRGRKSNPIA